MNQQECRRSYYKYLQASHATPGRPRIGGIGQLIDTHSPVPLYHQVRAALTRKISSGEWSPGDTIPPERELIAMYQVSRTTVRQAVDDMVTSGLLHRVQGRGTFVSERTITHTLADLTGFVEELVLRGLDPTILILSCALEEPPARVGEALRLARGQKSWRVVRLVQMAEEPLFVDCSYFSPALSTVLTRGRMEKKAIYQLLEENEIMLTRGTQEITALGMDAETAGHLQCDTGTPALAVTRTTYSSDDRPVEWSRAVYRSDRYRYVVDLRRGHQRTYP